MPTIQFINADPNQIIQESIDKYEAISGFTLNPADAERISIDVMAYREMGILGKMETAMHQNFVQLANGFALDYWGELFGVLRTVNEEDDDYRVRILSQNKFQAVGTRAFYIAKIKTIAHVSDARLISKQDDNTLPPGRVVICVIEKDTTSVAGVIKGGVMSITDVTKTQPILDILTDAQNNLIGDMFSFQASIPLAANGTIVVRKKIGVVTSTIYNAVNAIIDDYFYKLSLDFNNEFGDNDLAREIKKNNDVSGIVTNSFPNLPIKAYKEFWVRGSINLSII